MPQIVQLGQINLAALNVPDLIVEIVPPQLLINGVPSNIVGLVGTASWGQKNAPVIVGGYASGVQQFGYPQPRKYDAMTALWAACQQGAQAFRVVRVSDGTDTAASVVVLTNCITFTGKWTGSLGNNITVSISPGSQANTQKAVVSMGSTVPETFDNISQGVSVVSVTAGTGYTSVPLISAGAPNLSTGRQPNISASLKVVSGTLGAAGSGYVVNDTITLANGVVLTVNTVTSGAIATFTVTNPGSLTSGSAPTNPVAQVSTSGVGTGATFNLTWGLGPATIVDGGAGYTSAPTLTLTGGGAGTGGSYTATIAYWTNMASAINGGVSGLRGPSQLITATAGAGTSTPVTASYALTGGSDGAAPANIGVSGAPALIGQDVSGARTGMYALRASLVAIAALVDCDDSTTWTTQVSFGLAEGIYMVGTGPVGDTISNASSVKATAGIDNYTFKLMFGDWITINDPVTGAQRLVSPQGFIVGIMGNQAPHQSPLNKPLYGIVGTQKSQTGVQYTSADLQALAVAGIDVICNPCPGGNYFGCRLGINTSSNLAVNGDNYTRLTWFIARTVSQGMGSYVGQLQTPDERRRAKNTLTAFFSNLVYLGMIGTADGSDAYQITLDATNNPQALVALGYQFAYVKVVYLSVIRYFVIDLEGGQTVQISASPPVGVAAAA